MAHPKGLYLLFTTEMAERFSYYGMRALFMLYMINALMMSQEDASQIYGSYTGLVYLTPLIGGIVADRYWGNRKSIIVGGMMMALGQFLLFLSASMLHQLMMAKMLMFAGLAFLIFGNGFFKPNISTMVGDLYEPTDPRKDSAFTIFYMGINLGATFAPLWCGYVGAIDYKWGYLSACVAMLLSVAVFKLLQNKYLVTPEGVEIGMPPSVYKHNKPVFDRATGTVEMEAEDDAVKPSSTKADEFEKEVETEVKKSGMGRMIVHVLGFFVLAGLFSWLSMAEDGSMDYIGACIYSACIVMPVFIATDPSLTSIERTRIFVIYIIAFFVIFFWAAFEQAGSSLMVFAEKNTDRTFWGWEMPSAWTQSFNAVAVVCLAPLFAAMWTFLGRKHLEPASPVKQAIGLFLLSLGYLVIAFGVKGVGAETKVSIFWLVSLYVIHTCGELSLSPIGLSMVNKLSPARMASLLMGVWFLSTATANKFAGELSKLYPVEGEPTKSIFGYEIHDLHDFFMVFVVMSAVAGVCLLAVCPKLKKMMGGID